MCPSSAVFPVLRQASAHRGWVGWWGGSRVISWLRLPFHPENPISPPDWGAIPGTFMGWRSNWANWNLNSIRMSSFPLPSEKYVLRWSWLLVVKKKKKSEVCGWLACRLMCVSNLSSSRVTNATSRALLQVSLRQNLQANWVLHTWKYRVSFVQCLRCPPTLQKHAR